MAKLASWMQVLGEYSQAGREPSPVEVLTTLQKVFPLCKDDRARGYVLTALSKQALHISQPQEMLETLREALGERPSKDIIQVSVA